MCLVSFKISVTTTTVCISKEPLFTITSVRRTFPYSCPLSHNPCLLFPLHLLCLGQEKDSHYSSINFLLYFVINTAVLDCLWWLILFPSQILLQSPCPSASGQHFVDTKWDYINLHSRIAVAYSALWYCSWVLVLIQYMGASVGSLTGVWDKICDLGAQIVCFSSVPVILLMVRQLFWPLNSPCLIVNTNASTGTHSCSAGRMLLQGRLRCDLKLQKLSRTKIVPKSTQTTMSECCLLKK